MSEIQTKQQTEDFGLRTLDLSDIKSWNNYRM